MTQRVIVVSLVTLLLGCGLVNAASVSGGAVLVDDSFDVAGRTATVSGDPNIFVRRGSFADPFSDTSEEDFQLAVTTDPPAAVTGHVNYTAPEPVTAGTVFTIRRVRPTHDRNTSFDVSLDGAGNVFHDEGIPDDTWRLRINTFAQPVTTSSMDFDIELAQVDGFSGGGELYGSAPRGWMMTPQQFEPIDVDPTAISSKDSLDWNPSSDPPVDSPLELLVNKNPDGTYAWDSSAGAFNNGDSSEPYEVYMDLGEKDVSDVFSVGGLLLSSRGDHPPHLDIFTGDGTTWSSVSAGRVEMSGPESELITVMFDQPLNTTHLMFRMDANESWLLNKAIPLGVVPEPAMAALLLAALGLLVARRSTR